MTRSIIKVANSNEASTSDPLSIFFSIVAEFFLILVSSSGLMGKPVTIEHCKDVAHSKTISF